MLLHTDIIILLVLDSDGTMSTGNCIFTVFNIGFGPQNESEGEL